MSCENVPIPRKRDAEATAAAILGAARRLFTEKGFDAAGTREIAQAAGVNVALISRYFGSKERLFHKAVLDEIAEQAGAWNPAQDIAGEVAAMLADKASDVEFDPVVAVLRSANSPVVGPALRLTMEKQVIAPLAARLGGDNARERAALLVALISGYDVMVRMIGIDLAEAAGRDALHARLRTMIATFTGGD